jgi:hypothetical protein
LSLALHHVARVRSQVTPCEIFGRQSDMVHVFLRILVFNSVTIIPSMIQARLYLHVTLTRSTNDRILGTFQKAITFTKIGQRLSFELFSRSLRTVLWLGPLIVEFSLLRVQFEPELVHMIFVVNKMAVGHTFL